MNRKEADHHANQRNPEHIARKLANDNRSRQLNPKDPVYQLGRSHLQPKPRTK